MLKGVKRDSYLPQYSGIPAFSGIPSNNRGSSVNALVSVVNASRNSHPRGDLGLDKRESL